MSQQTKREVDNAKLIKLGRTLRRVQRTMKQTMRELGIEEDEVILRRKKRRKAAPKESKAA